MDKKNVKQGPDTRRKCPICRRRYDGLGHNAIPVWPGRCCDRCFRDYVLPMRIMLVKQQQNGDKEQ